ncbi:hypothetical protein ABKN59_006099 [Abortiporus biennis]
MLAPFPVRLRSNSTPPRPCESTSKLREMNSNDAPLDTTCFPMSSPSGSRPSSPKSAFKTPASSSSNAPPQARESRRRFRFKRPSSSSSAMQPTHKRDITTSVSHSAIPPSRPPRNPARMIGSAFPLAELSGNKARHLTSVSETRLISSQDSKTLVTFPLSGPSEIALQRRKSKKKTSEAPAASEPGGALQFSTVDRTILGELKQKMQARDAQFALRNGKRHHPYSSAEVPYPTSYERHVTDNDIWETKWAQQACGSVTWHIFKEPPAKVLDIGCGVGTWILDCARQWKHSHFVGVDIVPLYPDLHQVGSPLASRITWVQANILERLPFQDEEFDYVHIKRIARGVPEDKWDSLLEEISRVMKPGAAIEIFEEDLYFPGSIRQPDSTLSTSHAKDASPVEFERPRAPTPLSSFHPRPSSIGAQSSTSPVPIEPPRSRSYSDLLQPPQSPISDSTCTTESSVHTPEPTLQLPAPSVRPPVNPCDHSVLEYIYTEMHASRFINLEPLSLLANSLSLYFKDVRTHPPLLASFPPLQPSISSQRGDTTLPTDSRRSSLRTHPDSLSSHESTFDSGNHNSSITTPSTIESTTGPLNVEHIVKGSNQFVTYDSTRISAFSPSALASFPSPTSPTNHSKFLPSISDMEPFALPPTTASSRGAQLIYRLPNQKLDFDINSLNTHLLLRVQEVLGCAESMWDFVLSYQNIHSRRTSATVLRVRGFFMTMSKASDEVLHQALMSMERDDFDSLLTWFELDMRDSMGLSSAIQTRLGWSPPRLTHDTKRHEFERLCTEWSRYEANPVQYMATASRPRSSTLPSQSQVEEGLLKSPPLSPLSESTLSLISQTASGTPSQVDLFDPSSLDVGEVITGGMKAAQMQSMEVMNHVKFSEDSLITPPSFSTRSTIPSAVSKVPPTKRLSRTLRVLVAWKA